MAMVECSHKRPQISQGDSSEQKERSHFLNVQDELMVDIFCRLPCVKSVFRCKCVCKRWAALDSDPYFVSRFIASKVQVQGPAPCIEDAASYIQEKHMTSTEGSFAMVISSYFSLLSQKTCKGFTISLKDPNVNIRNFSASSLPIIVEGDATRHDLTVIGACHDLLLYWKQMFDRYDFYICNLQTKQWIRLPSLPNRGKLVQIGFICDPYYSSESRDDHSYNNIIVNPAYRYSIAVAHSSEEHASEIRAYLFLSNSSQLTEVVLSVRTQCKLMSSSVGFSFAGKLHFRSSQGMIGFDPYGCVNKSNTDVVIHCNLISWSAGFRSDGAYIGVSQGNLHVSQLTNDRACLWVLKDYKRGKWTLLHSIATEYWILDDYFGSRFLEIRKVLAIHSIHSEMIYMSGPDYMLLCNAQTREAEVVSRIPANLTVYHVSNIFNVMLPFWPTPLPTLSSG